ncbi:MAG: recombinase RmuC [Gammaproteobacteria bacterium RIFOXYB2_FULL_38_6]|nr:MAG: recombinase RmuC [Gammaproteobacteria bacterium RIFOXYB2_FULL_38_6]
MNTLGIFVIISLVLIFIAIIFLILQKYFSKDSHQELWFQLLELIQTAVQKNMADVREQISNSLKQHAELLTKQIEQLTQQTSERLKEISGQVDKRLADGFEKTTATFTDILKRLTIIDEAQKKITELSNNVVSLEEILSDKRSRGAFGEVQLAALIRNVMPEKHFALQHVLSNGKRADCLLFLPEPTGNMVIDSKFPLETYHKLMDTQLASSEKNLLEQQFKRDIQKHIQDIAEKYIIPGETSDGAMMFIPAEAVFAEIHAHYPECVERAHQSRVWLVSPTTMVAILTTVRAVLKDAATREQVHIIQQHLIELGKDFERFQKRMDNLAQHIDQANRDVQDVHTSSKKITGRFEKIEQVELEQKSP